jgi:hypothetical protein
MVHDLERFVSMTSAGFGWRRVWFCARPSCLERLQVLALRFALYFAQRSRGARRRARLRPAHMDSRRARPRECSSFDLGPAQRATRKAARSFSARVGRCQRREPDTSALLGLGRWSHAQVRWARWQSVIESWDLWARACPQICLYVMPRCPPCRRRLVAPSLEEPYGLCPNAVLVRWSHAFAITSG